MWPLMNNAVTVDDKLELVKFITTSDHYTSGPRVLEFENAWSNWLGSKYSLYVSSGSTANFLLLAAIKEKYNLQNGDKVLVPACTWVTNVSPVIQLGLEPVFCDVNLNNYSFDEARLPSDEDIKVVFVTYLLGLDAPIERFKEKYPSAIFIEDICESHGVTGPDGTKRGATSSLGSTFSFYYGHHMTTIEGGMISTNDADLYELMKIKRSHGMARNHSPDYFKKACAQYPHIDARFLFMTDGYNFRNNDICATLGLSQLKRLDNSIEIRKRNYKLFIEILNEKPDLFYIPCENVDSNSSFCFPIVCRQEGMMEKLKLKMDELKIEHRPIVSGNLLLHPFLSKWADTVSVPNANTLNSNGVYIGNSQFVTPEMVSMLRDILCT